MDDEDTMKIELVDLMPGVDLHRALDRVLTEYDYARRCLAGAVQRLDCLAVEIYASEAVRSWITAHAALLSILSTDPAEHEPALIEQAQTSLRNHHRALVGLFLEGDACLSSPTVSRLFEQLRRRLADAITVSATRPHP